MSAKKVLIADYERSVRESLGLVFAQHGCECRTVEEGEEALATAAAWVPDVVVMDLLLIENARTHRDRIPAAVILLLTSTSPPTLLKAAEELGLRVFQKPVRPQILLEAAGAL
ncbi:response regulator [Granulicella aggregans]|uniref:response regulator n=1 Tax=Granulicella aggregans TaxID=474949 RepID=UPI001FE800BF|nr:response regulator [Granulicella aggregans]